MLTTPENTTNWRDLADQPTSQQLAWLAELGRRPLRRTRPDVDGMPAVARMYTERNTLSALYADVPPPADAIGVSVWKEHDGQVSRCFRGAERGIKVRFDKASSQNDAVLRQGHHGGTAEPGLHAFRKSPPPKTFAAHQFLSRVRSPDRSHQELCRNPDRSCRRPVCSVHSSRLDDLGER